MIGGLTILNLILFLLAVCLTLWNIHERFNTNKTTTSTKNEKVEHIQFPLKFSILINPGFHLSQLKTLGYQSSNSYIFGINKWGKPRIGWAGLTEDGAAIGNVSGKITNSTKLEKEGAVHTRKKYKVFLETLFFR